MADVSRICGYNIKDNTARNTLNSIFTCNSYGTVSAFPDGSKAPVKSAKVRIRPFQAGTGDPTPSNIRNFTGFSSGTIIHTGQNVWDETWEKGTINATTGANASSTNQIRSKGYIPIKPNTYYSSNIALLLCYYDNNKTFISSNSATLTQLSPDNAYFLRFRTASSYGATYKNDISINAGSVQTYEKYQVIEKVNVDWTTEAGTLYGGTLDLNTGVLSIDYMQLENLSSKNWTRTGTTSTNYRFETTDYTSLFNDYNSETDTTGYYYNDDLEYVENSAVKITDYIKTGHYPSIDVNLSSCTTANIGIRINWFDEDKNILFQNNIASVANQLVYSTWVPSNAAYCRISTNPSYAPISTIIFPIPNVLMNNLSVCNKYKYLTPTNNNTDNLCYGFIEHRTALRIRDNNYSDATTFATSLSDCVIYIPLKEPLITYQLDPVQLKTILGSNTFYADFGNTDITYYSNPAIPTTDGQYSLKVNVSGTSYYLTFE